MAVTFGPPENISDPQAQAWLSQFYAWVISPESSDGPNFLQSGTGATPRTVQNKLREISFSVTDFSSLQNAIDAAPTGSELYLPSGTYTITSNLTVSKALKIYGDGPGKTIVNRTTAGSTTAAFSLTASDISLCDMTIYGPSSATYVANEHGINAVGSSGSELYDIGIQNVEVYNFGYGGILLEYCNRSSVKNCLVHDCGYIGIGMFSCINGDMSHNVVHDITPGNTGAMYGIVASQRTSGDTSSSQIVIGNNTIYDIDLWEAIDDHGSSYVTIIGNTGYNCRLGINISPSGTISPTHVSIIGNTLKCGYAGGSNAYRGIGSGGYDAAHPSTHITVIGNTLTGFGYADTDEGSIMFQFVDGLTISGNVINDNQSNGICLKQSCLKTTIVGNTINGVVNGIVGIAGIKVTGASQSGNITGNYIYSTAEPALSFGADNPGVSLNSNVLVTAGTALTNPVYSGPGLELSASDARNLGSIAVSAQEIWSVTVAGAELGDFVQVSCNDDTAGLQLTGQVISADTVRIIAANNHTGAINMGDATFYIRVIKK
jgi:parallel beta-helix repeat protein